MSGKIKKLFLRAAYPHSYLSEALVNYLRSKGRKIGKNTYIYSSYKARIDVTNLKRDYPRLDWSKIKERVCNDVVLFNEKKDCSGCGGCMNICPRQAITMEEDEYGFLYPVIHQDHCISCGLCNRVCSYQHKDEVQQPQFVGASAARDGSILLGSASGGVFTAVAREILKRNGVVYGCSMELRNNRLSPEHIRVSDDIDLPKLQGSKYVQSYIGNTFRLVKQDLKNSKVVLFSGTPCQVAALKSFLGTDVYPNLFTIDIICHGVPSAAFFNGYIRELERKVNGKATGFRFRDKSAGWGMKGRFEYIDKAGIQRSRFIYRNLSSYFKLFLDSEIYRENCYSCKYAGEHRPGDITIGDYWKIEKQHPDYLLENGGTMDKEKGISCVIINNMHGQELLDCYGGGLDVKPSDFNKAAEANAQLRKPSTASKRRQQIFDLYKSGGYRAVENWFNRKLGLKRFVYQIWSLLPLSVQKRIKKETR